MTDSREEFEMAVNKMPNKKLTDNEIIKALECCISDKPCIETGCPLHNDDMCGADTQILEKYALDLINRLQADVENYKQIAENQQKITMDRGFEIKRLKEKIESLQAENERLKKGWKADILLTQNTKAEAYKECIEKVKERLSTCVTDTQQMMFELRLDNLLKELVGE